MRKIGSVGGIVTAIIWISIIVAGLKHFNWDPVALFTFLVDLFLKVIDKLSNWIGAIPIFQNLLSQ